MEKEHYLSEAYIWHSGLRLKDSGCLLFEVFLRMRQSDIELRPIGDASTSSSNLVRLMRSAFVASAVQGNINERLRRAARDTGAELGRKKFPSDDEGPLGYTCTSTLAVLDRHGIENYRRCTGHSKPSGGHGLDSSYRITRLRSKRITPRFSSAAAPRRIRSWHAGRSFLRCKQLCSTVWWCIKHSGHFGEFAPFVNRLQTVASSRRAPVDRRRATGISRNVVNRFRGTRESNCFPPSSLHGPVIGSILTIAGTSK